MSRQDYLLRLIETVGLILGNPRSRSASELHVRLETTGSPIPEDTR